MAPPKLTLYLDIVSPFAYLAFYITKNAPVFKQCEVTYIPIFLGGLMKACGNQPPINIKNKDKWIGTERLRWAKYSKIPMREEMPEGFPVNTIHLQRALCALVLQKPAKLTQAFDALYAALWVEGKAAHKPEVFIPIFAKVLGSEEEAKKIVEAGSSPEAKKLLAGNTDKSFESGAFGLPWFEATNSEGQTEGFWGYDHLGQVIEHLGLDRSGTKEVHAML